MKSEQLESEFVDFRCPFCGSALSFHEARVGTAQECPTCYKIVVVPTQDSFEGGKFPIPINTGRLCIRFLRTEDQPDWLEFVANPESYRYLEGYAPSEDEAQAWFVRSQRVKLTDADAYIAMGIELKDQSKLIGSVSFSLFVSENAEAHNRQGTFLMMIHPKFRRQGYATETIGALLRFAFTGIALHDLRVSIDMRNLAARRTVEKAGMRLEGEFIEDRYIKGEWVSTAWYRLLSREYEARKPAPFEKV